MKCYISLVFVTTGAFYKYKNLWYSDSIKYVINALFSYLIQNTYRATAAAELLCFGKYSAFSSSVILSNRWVLICCFILYLEKKKNFESIINRKKLELSKLFIYTYLNVFKNTFE